MAGIVLKHRSGNLKQVSSNKYRLVNAAALAAVLCVSSLALASCNKSSSSPKVPQMQCRGWGVVVESEAFGECLQRFGPRFCQRQGLLFPNEEADYGH